VQYGAHFVRRQINICLAVVTLNKAMTIAVAKYRAFEFSEESGGCAGIEKICFDKKSLS
jgi:hypothetical protein